MALTTSPSAPTGSRSWSRTERADAAVELGRAGLHPLDHEADLDEVPGARSPVSKYGVHDSGRTARWELLGTGKVPRRFRGAFCERRCLIIRCRRPVGGTMTGRMRAKHRCP